MQEHPHYYLWHREAYEQLGHILDNSEDRNNKQTQNNYTRSVLLPTLQCLANSIAVSTIY